MSELGKAYVQIVPSAKGISGAIQSELGGEAQSAGQSAGMNIAGAIKTAIAAAGIGTAIKSALEAGGDLQQSFGGLETLYGDAADGAKAYAAEAAKAGISANSYAEQAVSFGASLKQAFGGDTTAAMEAANTAILDMADNSAKMGTDIGSIQNAYQGFAKQNYTMLDNLKLGYGGTKAEMERLLEDAQKLSGIEYDMSNLGDIYSAIHVIQEDLGLTGVAAEEASSTFTGSLGAMQAAGQNLLANIALGEDIGPALDALGETVNAFFFNNLVPMVGNILESLPELLSGVGSMIIQSLNIISTNSDEIIQTGLDIVTALAGAIVESAPYLLEAAINLLRSFVEALVNTDWVTVGNDLITSFRDSLDLAAGEILGTDTLTVESLISGIMTAATGLLETGGELILNLCEGLSQELPSILDTGIEVFTNLLDGILQNLPTLIETGASLILQFAEVALNNLPVVLEAGVKVLLSLVQGIINNLPALIESVAKVMAQIVSSIGEKLPTILKCGIEILGELGAGLIKAIPDLVKSIPVIVTAIFDAFGSVDWIDIGISIIDGIISGLADALGSLIEAAVNVAKQAFEAAKDFLGISSPSKEFMFIGRMVDEGFATGIEKSSGLVTDAIDDLSNDSIGQLSAAASADYNFNSTTQARNDEKMDVLLSMLTDYLPEIAENKGMSAESLYNGLNRQLGWALS